MAYMLKKEQLGSFDELRVESASNIHMQCEEISHHIESIQARTVAILFHSC